LKFDFCYRKDFQEKIIAASS